MRERVILAKFLDHRVILNFQGMFTLKGYMQDVYMPIFQKFFLFPKMAAILNFQIFDKNGKT